MSNFIWGSPIIDHYGDMTVTNHFTGDTCQLTFKPRGWKGSNSMEIRGKVLDKHGKLQWEIAGRWSTQLVARRAGSGSGELQPDAQLPDKPEYMLLWKNSEKPSNSPFNLTPYAITLNGKPDELGVYHIFAPLLCRGILQALISFTQCLGSHRQTADFALICTLSRLASSRKRTSSRPVSRKFSATRGGSARRASSRPTTPDGSRANRRATRKKGIGSPVG